MVPHTDSLWVAKRAYCLARRAGYARREAWTMAREIIETGAHPVVPVQRVDSARSGEAVRRWNYRQMLRIARAT